MKNWIQFVLLCAVLAFTINGCQSQSSFAERKLAAKAVLAGKCDFVVNASTEFFNKKRPLIGAIVAAVIASKCDCISDTIAGQFANEYDLESIKGMEQQPLESFNLVLQKLMEKNDKIVLDCIQKW